MPARERTIVRVSYSKAMDRVRIIFDDKSIYVIPRRLLEGLENGAARELGRIEILDHGPTISWPLLDVKHNVPKLLKGVYGSRGWMDSLQRMPRAVPGRPLFGSRRKKAEVRKRFFFDAPVVMTNMEAATALKHRPRKP